MKTILAAFVVLSSTLVLQARNLAVIESFGQAPLQQVIARTKANGDTVAPGHARVQVSLRLGSPNYVLPDGSWLYYGYSAQLAPSGPVHRGTLVVRFDGSRVSSLALADQTTVVTLRQSPRHRSPNQLLAVR